MPQNNLPNQGLLTVNFGMGKIMTFHLKIQLAYNFLFVTKAQTPIKTIYRANIDISNDIKTKEIAFETGKLQEKFQFEKIS